MSLSFSQMKELVESGLTSDQILIVARIIEEKQLLIDNKKKISRDKKRKQRELSPECPGTVPGHSEMLFPLPSPSMVSPTPPSLTPPPEEAKKEKASPKRKKGVLVNLETYESQNGELKASDLSGFEGLSEQQIGLLLEKFKNGCRASDRRYVNFKAAFKSWDWKKEIAGFSTSSQSEKYPTFSKQKQAEIYDLPPEFTTL